MATVEHSLFTGGHFHSKEYIDRSLYSMLVEHYCSMASNECHGTAATTFHRLASEYAQIILADDFEEANANSILPSDERLADLAVLIRYLRRLGPGPTFNEPGRANEHWQATVDFEEDEEYAEECLRMAIVKKMNVVGSNMGNLLQHAHRRFAEKARALYKMYKDAKPSTSWDPNQLLKVTISDDEFVRSFNSAFGQVEVEEGKRAMDVDESEEDGHVEDDDQDNGESESESESESASPASDEQMHS